jgi:hypothetical protein
MVDLRNSWVRFTTIPDDVIEGMPKYLRTTFAAARDHRFEVEMLSAGAKVPGSRRSARRLVLVADDVGRSDAGGPMAFDLAALTDDVRAAQRLFVISTTADVEFYAAIYAAAVEDLSGGCDVALVVETRPMFAKAWAMTLSALQNGEVAPALTAASTLGARSRC